ncbi:hypothetical protein [Ruminococcus sp.]
MQSGERRISKSVIKQSGVGVENSAPLLLFLLQTFHAKSDSDFAAVELEAQM